MLKHCRAAALVLLVLTVDRPVVAGPAIVPGDMALRHDIQVLSDHGIITGPVTTWPLSWGPIAADIRAADSSSKLSPAVLHALTRVRLRADWEMRTDEISYRASVSVAEYPTRIRSFQNTPRATAEVGGGIDWTGDWLAISLNGQVVDSPADGEEYRADGSSIGIVLGNFSISLNTLSRWWGPGWDGSLILSSNARPIPSISVDRNFTKPFASKWLSWLGPWDLSIQHGQFETDREIPNARFFGMRFNLKPIPSLEIGLSRTAQWCGNGRPCGFDTFVDLLFGNDNVGDDGIDQGNEPGNQLAGADLRWATSVFGHPIAVYGQLIGEDEAGGFPSRYLGLFGIEASGMLASRWSYRWFGEFAGTSCQFNESSELFNCAYNHRIYRTGYRYRGRSVGHGADNDARVLSTGVLLVDANERQWQAIIRYAALNRGGSADPRNSLTATAQDVVSIDLSHSRVFSYGWIEVGLGIERTDDEISGEVSNQGRAFLQWRSSY